MGVDYFRQRHNDKGIRFFEGRPADSRVLLGRNHSSLAEMREVLKIYTASLSGRDFMIAASEEAPLSAARFLHGREHALRPRRAGAVR